jgi:hypothetical protein
MAAGVLSGSSHILGGIKGAAVMWHGSTGVNSPGLSTQREALSLIKKPLAALSAVVLCFAFSLFVAPLSAYAAGDVAIDAATFPDEAFRKVVSTFDTNSDGQLSETEIAEITTIDASNAGIASLVIGNPVGLGLFTALTNLDVSGNKLEELPLLPETLTTLDVSGNELTALPPLPLTLTTLDVSDNKLPGLPYLPPVLETLDASGNVLTALPALSDTLTALNVSGNELPGLPNLPPTLTALDASDNALEGLPNLPPTLTALNVSDNALKGLPNLPPTLTTLDASDNELPGLPGLPPALTTLNVSGNELPALPPLPPTLTTLDASDNALEGLPGLPPALEALNISNNQLTALPPLPGTLKELDFSGNDDLTDLGDLSELQIETLDISGKGLTELPTLPTTLIVLNASDNQLLAADNLPASLTDFDGSGQSISLNLTGNSAQKWSVPVTLKSPVFGDPSISYENGVLTSTDSSVTTTTFTVDTNKAGMNISGTLSLTYATTPISVENITGVPGSTTVGVPLTLSGTVVPSNAAYKTIIWSVQNAGTTGATLSANTLNTTAAGTVIVKATIKNGVAGATDYTQTFTINVLSPEKDITSFTIADQIGDTVIDTDTISLTVPYGTDVTNLTPKIEITGVSVSPASELANDFTTPVTYTVLAENGTTKVYTVTVNVAPEPSDEPADVVAGGFSVGDADSGLLGVGILLLAGCAGALTQSRRTGMRILP